MTISDDILRRLFAVTVPADYIYADGCLGKDGLQFIADKPDGTRVLLCCEYTADMTCKITESTPLPANTIIGVENFTTTLNLGLQGYGATIAKGHDGIWHVSGILGDEWFKLGSCWVSSGLLWAEANPAIGTVRQSDITCIDWTLIPKTLKSATAMLDTKDWATPNNANPQERLHLRSQADKKSRSLGKYYNGTPIKVLERGKEWTKVQIGSVTGYMMTKYLLFGEEINKHAPALAYKTNVNLITEILWDDTSTTEKLTPYEVNQLLIIGVMEDEWYLVWEPNADRYGRILQSSLWDGNG